MEHITDTNITQQQPTAVTIGNSDGLHMGHRALISLTKQFAQEESLKSVVFSFSLSSRNVHFFFSFFHACAV